MTIYLFAEDSEVIANFVTRKETVNESVNFVNSIRHIQTRPPDRGHRV